MLMESCSAEAAKYGERFLERLQNKKIVEVTRPNTGAEYTGDLEKMDFERYQAFLASFAYKDLFADQEVSYGRY